MKFKFAFIALAAFLFFQVQSFSCTSIIVSGKATADGRPLMWKNRDTGAKENYIRHFPAGKGKYSFVAVVNVGSDGSKDVWMGTNSEGFSIMNTHSYNITDEATKDKDDLNGSIMRKALECCASVEDFEAFMKRMPKPWKASANFGVIDARGGAAYFEMNWTEFFKYDANDPEVAPDGYLVRTNFSFNGRPMTEGAGHIRYMEADLLMKEAMESGNVTPQFFIERAFRDYANPLLGIDYRKTDSSAEWATEQDIIVRCKTTCSAVAQGVKEGESPALSTMWTVVGYPGTTVCMPVWECCGQDGVPSLLGNAVECRSELAHWGYLLKEKVYCYDMDNASRQKYFRWSMLFNPQGTGYLQTVLKEEPSILEPYEAVLEKWRRDGAVDPQALRVLNENACSKISALYQRLLKEDF